MSRKSKYLCPPFLHIVSSNLILYRFNWLQLGLSLRIIKSGEGKNTKQQPTCFSLLPSLLPRRGGTQRARLAPGFSSDLPSTHLSAAASTLQTAQEAPPTPLSSRGGGGRGTSSVLLHILSSNIILYHFNWVQLGLSPSGASLYSAI
ncbi:hypothetical protein E2320_022901 [Naja naja]|nr:hypothetical protein E2320_022901 [Naja naja]